jgi:aspartate carbamoyltransferase catalytic subunit
MSLEGRRLVSVDDLSNGEIEYIFRQADTIGTGKGMKGAPCKGKIMASLFFEPSTRTRLSFETAMYRLGGNVIGAVELKSTSLAKGESIADMARVIGRYADIMVLRHPWEGAARVAAEYAGIPVINAGDGSHEHPTQTLCDLFTMRKSRKTIKGLKIALCGDLKYGRTVHSLIYALARLGAAAIIFSPGDGFQMPEHVIHKLRTEYGGQMAKLDARDLPTLVGAMGKTGEEAKLDAIYITPDRSHQLALIPSLNARIDLSEGVDALYMTRLQKERLETTSEAQNVRAYPVIDKHLLEGREFRNTLVMHPLPRVDELAYDMDEDPRSMYFEQVSHGVPVRMAIIMALLGVSKGDIVEPEDSNVAPHRPEYARSAGCLCKNPACVAVREAHYVVPRFAVVALRPPLIRCLYCDHEITPLYVGNIETGIYHTADDPSLDLIKPEHCLFFDNENQAVRQGLRPSRGRRRQGSECRDKTANHEIAGGKKQDK